MVLCVGVLAAWPIDRWSNKEGCGHKSMWRPQPLASPARRQTEGRRDFFDQNSRDARDVEGRAGGREHQRPLEANDRPEPKDRPESGRRCHRRPKCRQPSRDRHVVAGSRCFVASHFGEAHEHLGSDGDFVMLEQGSEGMHGPCVTSLNDGVIAYYSTGNQFERFRQFLELISRFEFQFWRCPVVVTYLCPENSNSNVVVSLAIHGNIHGTCTHMQKKCGKNHETILEGQKALLTPNIMESV